MLCLNCNLESDLTEWFVEHGEVVENNLHILITCSNCGTEYEKNLELKEMEYKKRNYYKEE